MKLARLLLVALCLMGVATAAHAADDLAPNAEDLLQPVEAVEAVEPLATPADGCDPADLVLGIEGMAVLPQAGTCGACSSPNCVGATRGQACHLGSGQGWGNCNLYGSAFICSTGGLACECGTGPLP